jgi:hypothetical protein
MRRFSQELEDDREFEIGGEMFKWTYPHWETGAAIFDDTLTPEPSENGQPAFTFRADTEFAINKVPEMLDPENASHKRWKALVSRKTNPVPRFQIVALYRWLVEVTSGLPTTRPDAPGPEAQDSATSSQAGSSSKAAT